MKLWHTAAALAATLSLAGAAFAATVSVTGPASATPGGTVTVAVVLSPDLAGVYALQGGLMYDPAILAPLPSQDGAAQGFYAGSETPFPGETIPKDADLFRTNASQSGQIVFGYVKNPTNPPSSPSTSVPATALLFTFNVSPTADGATTVHLAPYTVNGQSMPAVLAGALDGSPIAVTADAALTITLGLRGDANGDALIDVRDVNLLLQAAGGIALPDGTTLIQRNADVWPAGAPDGALTLEDAVRVWRFINGLETDLH